MALVRDPYFWKRFSTAVHMDEELRAVDQGPQTKQYAASWLSQERRKSRRSIIWGIVIFFGVVLIIVISVVLWWLSKNNWLQPRPDTTQ
ncbi:hypothetical protein N7489_001528 [Penicillium chrysogenum]|uniref:Uncharacterized protein n=1 Tax=Penicillium chrysogenum TaxID=5076 RepID=A0ABQ8WJ32_PENCH|nr:uncharacterized protein N7489_001528 [Penicillium chrysogenum]KAJ5251118.1 hypothetical protein N7489_001528 [Penicillium chrysogenum]KAJ5262553.1 hypothetical protein N7524_007858 [Penicillium chrysogenum]KAJ5270018.1 hypothetical protein N7505_005776 [Penicillium chrysogenum]KAJ6147247.1 hypothetical protein N7497_009229 [Penicillium chrysogenum]